MNYLIFLDGDRQLEIIDDYCEEYDLPQPYRKNIRFDVVLGPSPSTNLDSVNRRREEEGLEGISESILE